MVAPSGGTTVASAVCAASRSFVRSGLMNDSVDFECLRKLLLRDQLGRGVPACRRLSSRLDARCCTPAGPWWRGARACAARGAADTSGLSHMYRGHPDIDRRRSGV